MSSMTHSTLKYRDYLHIDSKIEMIKLKSESPRNYWETKPTALSLQKSS